MGLESNEEIPLPPASNMDRVQEWERQLAEAESIEAIYSDEFHALGSWKAVSEKEAQQTLPDIGFTLLLNAALSVRCQLVSGYPDQVPPSVELIWTGAGDIKDLRTSLNEYISSLPLGEEMVYAIITWCQDQLADLPGTSLESPTAAVTATAAEQPAPSGEFPEGVAVAQESANPLSKSVVSSSAPVEDGLHRLPLAEYYRAEALGEGACGSVMHVYDDDGQEWAAKQFEKAEDGGVDTTTLREIGLLRSFRSSGVMHPNIIALTDMSLINGELCMIMKNYQFSLMDALHGGAVAATKGSQIRIAKGLLSAVSYLHACKTMHRDIKPGNVMLDDGLEPVLIDFSLAKIQRDSTQVENRIPKTAKERRRKARGKPIGNQESPDMNHSQGVGTPLYMAPEVFHSSDYGLPADIWSSGIVLLEVFDSAFCEKLGKCEKEKAAHTLVAETVDRLGMKPVPSLLRSLLSPKPLDRVTAKAALKLLQEAVPPTAFGDNVIDVPPVEVCALTSSALTQMSIPPSAIEEKKRWVSIFRCSAHVAKYAQAYMANSALACKNPLHAVVLAGRLHETDVDAAPLYDIEELGDWAYEEEDEDLLDDIGELENYADVEQRILRELNFVLY